MMPLPLLFFYSSAAVLLLAVCPCWGRIESYDGDKRKAYPYHLSSADADFDCSLSGDGVWTQGVCNSLVYFCTSQTTKAYKCPDGLLYNPFLDHECQEISVCRGHASARGFTVATQNSSNSSQQVAAVEWVYCDLIRFKCSTKKSPLNSTTLPHSFSSPTRDVLGLDSAGPRSLGSGSATSSRAASNTSSAHSLPQMPSARADGDEVPNAGGPLFQADGGVLGAGGPKAEDGKGPLTCEECTDATKAARDMFKASKGFHGTAARLCRGSLATAERCQSAATKLAEMIDGVSAKAFSDRLFCKILNQACVTDAEMWKYQLFKDDSGIERRTCALCQEIVEEAMEIADASLNEKAVPPAICIAVTQGIKGLSDRNCEVIVEGAIRGGKLGTSGTKLFAPPVLCQTLGCINRLPPEQNKCYRAGAGWKECGQLICIKADGSTADCKRSQGKQNLNPIKCQTGGGDTECATLLCNERGNGFTCASPPQRDARGAETNLIELDSTARAEPSPQNACYKPGVGWESCWQLQCVTQANEYQYCENEQGRMHSTAKCLDNEQKEKQCTKLVCSPAPDKAGFECSTPPQPTNQCYKSATEGWKSCSMLHCEAIQPGGRSHECKPGQGQLGENSCLDEHNTQMSCKRMRCTPPAREGAAFWCAKADPLRCFVDNMENYAYNPRDWHACDQLQCYAGSRWHRCLNKYGDFPKDSKACVTTLGGQPQDCIHIFCQYGVQLPPLTEFTGAYCIRT